jgi:hypothetical protein
MGFSPIPFTAIYEYCLVYKIEDFEEFSFLMRKMDDTLVQLESKKSQGVATHGTNTRDKKNSS